MVDYVDLSDDVILPDGFDADAIDAAGSIDEAMSIEETAPTNEQAPEDSSENVEQAPEQEEASVPPEDQVAALEQTITQSEPAVPQTIKVKFNHEERELGLEEAAMYAQKGMNYDKLEERLKAFEANSAKSDRLAKELGYADTAEMIAKAEENFINRQVKELVEAGNTEAMARFLVEQKMAKAAANVQVPETKPQEQPTPEATSRPLISAERKAELDEFVRAYPGITKLPDEVLTANRNGVRLKAAYENYQLKQKYEEQQKQLNILKQNQAAADRAPVTGTVGRAAPKKEEPEDPFLKGFDAAY